MAHAFTLPDLGEGLESGEITRWLVFEGEAVAEHQPIAFDVDVHASGSFVVNWTRDGIAMPPVRQYKSQSRWHADGTTTDTSI